MMYTVLRLRDSISLNSCYVVSSVSRRDKPELAWWGIMSVLDYLLFLCVIILIIYYFQPAARKAAEKSGPGAGFTVLSEKTLFLGQKVSTWQKCYFINSSRK